jgi:hypothetical protein
MLICPDRRRFLVDGGQTLFITGPIASQGTPIAQSGQTHLKKKVLTKRTILRHGFSTSILSAD